MRRFSLIALLLGLLLVPAGLAVAVSDHQRGVAEVERYLSAEADEHSGRLDAYFERARSVTLLTANQSPFQGFYAAPGSRRDKIRGGAGGLSGAVHSMEYLERLYPTAIGEVCFIDRSGAENARVVRGRIARASELSPHEERNPFFTPTFAGAVGHVYQARPYVSPDTGEWVVSNSTVVPSPGGVKRAIVHFEVTIESFRKAFAPDRPDFALYVVDRLTGRVVIDGRRPQAHGRLGAPGDRRFAAIAKNPDERGLGEVDGHKVSFRRVAEQPGNANDWVLVARSTAATPSLLSHVGALPLTFGVLAAVLIAFGAAGLRVQRRELMRAADTDALTGLANRRRLVLDLERRFDRDDECAVLALFDLDGFKNYNDSFGHLAGDALLARLGNALADAVGSGATAYRLGGDEFCVLGPAEREHALVEAALRALHERGEGFDVAASHGRVRLPVEAADPTEALRVADQRMYAAKHTGRATPGRQSADVLLRALAERHPDLGHQLWSVADLAVAAALRLGITGEEAEHVRHAAELHDIGKVAIPASILGKPGPLDEEEWTFMRRHTVIGERIVAAAPALAPVGRLVRGSHERWDGRGYPDGLAGEDIPLGARVVAVCDAYDAMLTERPYQPKRPPAAALDELRRCSGTQFDPAVVEAFAAVVAERRADDSLAA